MIVTRVSYVDIYTKSDRVNRVLYIDTLSNFQVYFIGENMEQII